MAVTNAPEKTIRAAFLGLLVILVSVATLAYRSTTTLVTNAQSVKHAQEVQTELWELLTGVNVAEISQGRFVMTGDDRLLVAFEASTPHIIEVERSLRTAIADDPEQLANFIALQTLIDRRIEVARELIALRRTSGSEAAVKRIATGETAALQAQIRGKIDLLTTVQQSIQKQRESSTLKTARETGAILLVGALLAFAGVVGALVFASRSLSARKIFEREQRLESALSAARVGMWDWDLLTGQIVWSRVHEEIWGMQPGTFHGAYEQFDRQVHDDDREVLKSAIQHALDTKGEYSCEFRIVLPDGSIRWVAGRGHGIYEDGKPLRMTGVIADITERRTADLARDAVQAQLQASEARLRGILDGMFAFVGLFSTDGIMLHANRAPLEAARIKESEVIGKPVVDTYWLNHSPKTQAQISLAIARAARGETVREELDIRIADGSLIILDTIFSPLFDTEGRVMQVVGSGVEVTARKKAEAMRQKLEAQLWQAQKMEALGALAGGVAHDFNNILTAIAGNAELAKLDVGADHPAAASIAEISKASQRAKFLVQQILAFSRKQSSERICIALEPVVEECAAMLRATLPATVDLRVHCAREVPNVLADANQIHQVLLNLSTNAWHSLSGQTGRIQIDLETTAIDKQVSQQLPNLQVGLYACLRVTDDGVGMNDATLARIFEPFYTTKSVGEGTGLGLSVVDGIIKSHDGAIRVTSTPGAGSVFELFLPAAEGTAAPQLHVVPTAAARGNGQHILYLDDDEALVSLTVKLLRRKGFDVHGFTAPQKALEILRADSQRFDLVVTDYSMPGTSGIQVAKELRQLRPDLPVVLASGYVTDDLKLRAREVGVRHVIYKPQTVTELCEVVQRTLDEVGGQEKLKAQA
jgi:PAS domain S-box-containing protein